MFGGVGTRGRKSSETNLVTGEKFMLEFSNTSEGHMKVRRPTESVFGVGGVEPETRICRVSPVCLLFLGSKRKEEK